MQLFYSIIETKIHYEIFLLFYACVFSYKIVYCIQKGGNNMKQTDSSVVFGTPSKLFWGAKDISRYLDVSVSTAYHFMNRIRKSYEIDDNRCVYGKIPSNIVIDFFKQEIKKKEQ